VYPRESRNVDIYHDHPDRVYLGYDPCLRPYLAWCLISCSKLDPLLFSLDL
jgi:hypothetical protein